MKPIQNLTKGVKHNCFIAFIHAIFLYTFLFLCCLTVNSNNFFNVVNSLQKKKTNEKNESIHQSPKSNEKVDVMNTNTVNSQAIKTVNIRNYKIPLHLRNVTVIDNDIESSLQIESWMLNSELFSGRSNESGLEVEQPLKLESWMLDYKYFGNSYELIQEKKLNIESWMIDDHFWNF